MQFKKLTPAQKSIKHWRERRNRIVSRLLATDPFLSREQALRRANREMRKR